MKIARNRKKQILSDRAELLRQQQELGTKLMSLERSVLRSVGKSEQNWSIVTKSGKISIIEKSLSEPSEPRKYFL